MLRLYTSSPTTVSTPPSPEPARNAPSSLVDARPATPACPPAFLSCLPPTLTPQRELLRSVLTDGIVLGVIESCLA